MRDNLPKSLELLFGHEGGYSNVKTDKGGPTKFGITHRTLAAHRGVASVTADQVKALTLNEAAQIYERSYWAQSGGDLLPAGLDYAVFDFGVGSGPARAVKELQGAVGVPQDGIIGEATMSAVNRYIRSHGLGELIREYCLNRRMKFLRSLGGPTGWKANGRGWEIRVTGKDPKGQWKDQKGVVGNAIQLAVGASDPRPEPLPNGGQAKGNPSDVSITEKLKDPAAWGPLTGLLTGLGAIFSGTGPVQWALAACLLAGTGYGLWRLINRSET